MSGAREMTRNLLAQEPGRVDCYANAANAQTIAQHELARHYGGDARAIAKQQINHLMQAHGLTVTRARTVAALAWRAL